MKGPKTFEQTIIGMADDWGWATTSGQGPVPAPLLEPDRLWAETYFTMHHRTFTPTVFETYRRFADTVCESPIEQRMLAILSCALPDVEIIEHNDAKLKAAMKADRIAIIPQARVLRFRADFIVQLPTTLVLKDHSSIVVECDGAAYHTGRQFARDQERNQAFRDLGITVMRFWGRQIHLEPKAVGNAVAYMVRHHMREHRRAA